MTILGLEPSIALYEMNFSALCALLYRDTVQQKHSNRGRLVAELTDKKAAEDKDKQARLKSIRDSSREGVEPMADILLEHLLAVHLSAT